MTCGLLWLCWLRLIDFGLVIVLLFCVFGLGVAVWMYFDCVLVCGIDYAYLIVLWALPLGCCLRLFALDFGLGFVDYGLIWCFWLDLVASVWIDFSLIWV